MTDGTVSEQLGSVIQVRYAAQRRIQLTARILDGTGRQRHNRCNRTDERHHPPKRGRGLDPSYSHREISTRCRMRSSAWKYFRAKASSCPSDGRSSGATATTQPAIAGALASRYDTSSR